MVVKIITILTPSRDTCPRLNPTWWSIGNFWLLIRWNQPPPSTRRSICFLWMLYVSSMEDVCMHGHGHPMSLMQAFDVLGLSNSWPLLGIITWFFLRCSWNWTRCRTLIIPASPCLWSRDSKKLSSTPQTDANTSRPKPCKKDPNP